MTFEHTWSVFEVESIDDDDVMDECHMFDSREEAMAYALGCMTPRDRFESNIRDVIGFGCRSVYSLFVVETEWTFDDSGMVIDSKKVSVPFYLDWGINDEMMELEND